MTHEENALVLYWLRDREKTLDWSLPRRTLQRALRGGEPISREIRDAMADWLEADAASLLVNRRGEMYYGLEDAVHIPKKDTKPQQPLGDANRN